MKTKTKLILGIIIGILFLVVIGLAVAFYLIAGWGGYYALFASKDRTDIMEEKSYTDENGITLPYRFYCPKDDKESYPLVLFLHGSGERGEDNERQVQVNSVTDTLLNEKNREQWPCYVVAPQCPKGVTWSTKLMETGSFSPNTEEEMLDALTGLVETLQEEYSIDADRIYVIGASMGAHAIWNLLGREPELFAAAVPICGCGDPDEAVLVKDIPIWIFHGAKDPTVPVSYSRAMVDALKAVGAENFRYTEYAGEKHQSWELAYREKDMFPWLFGQTR